jgi:hypothetical protein
MDKEIIVGILLTLAALLQALPKILDIFKSDISLSDNKQRDGNVINLMHRFRHDYSLRRVCIDAFHNGGHYYSGEGIAKVTRRYESVNHEIEPTIHKFQAVTTSVLSDSPAHVEREELIVDRNVCNPDPLEVQTKKYLRVFQHNGCYFLLSWGIYQKIFIPRKFKMCKVLVGVVYIEIDESNAWFDYFKTDKAEMAQFCKDVTEIVKLTFPKAKYEEKKYSLLDSALHRIKFKS